MNDHSSSNGDLWVVTGSASGVGAATVAAARTSGAEVFALDVQDAAGEAAAAACGARYLHCDVSRMDAWAAAAEAISAVGQPTHIHLNAGIQIAPPSAPLADYQLDAMTEARYRRMMGVNVDGVVFGLKTLMPLLANPAAIVVTCSLAGITPYPVDPLYAMSKHAVAGLVRSMAPALAEQGVAIHALCPGGIDTAIIPDEQRSAAEAQANSASLFMTPEHIAEEVLWLMNQGGPDDGFRSSGKTWAKVAATKPLFVIRAPGDKG